MISVSEEYKRLATANGREISCEIEVGELVFRNEDIVSFEFDDVVHPDEMAFGTTCSNRFHMEILTDRYIPLSSVVKPYVMFGECGERLLLGTFYIARRYRRRNRYSITCYDKMYQLDSEYKTDLVYPQTMQAVIDDLCQRLNLVHDIQCMDYTCGSIPADCTYREIIGWIAGAHGGMAKFSRDNVLKIKKCENCGETLRRNNYLDISIKEDAFEIRQINLVADELTTYSSGDGTKLTTYKQENPFGTQIIADRLYYTWGGFSYYGAEIEMQGLPYLEAGDIMLVQNDVDNSVFPIIISEINYKFDGGLSAELFSRSKNPVDDYDAHNEKKEQEEMYSNLAVVNFSVRNTTARKMETGIKTLLLAMDVDSKEPKTALLNAQLILTAPQDCTVTLTCDLNGEYLNPLPLQTLHANEPQTICLHNILEKIHQGQNAVTIWGETSAGYVVLEKYQGVLTVSGQYMNAAEIKSRPDYTAAQRFDLFSIADFAVVPAFGEGDFSAVVSDCNTIVLSDSVSGLAPGMNKINAPFSVSVSMPYRIYASSADLKKVIIIFTNAVSSENINDCLGAFRLMYSNGTEELTLSPLSLEFDENHTIIAEFDDFSDTIGDITLSYFEDIGNLKRAFGGGRIESFTELVTTD